MSSLLAKARERSRMRKTLIENTLGVDNLATALGEDDKGAKKKSSLESAKRSISDDIQGPGKTIKVDPNLESGPGSSIIKDNRHSGGSNVDNPGNDPEKNNEQEFRDSTAFLKGTQSQNPHNDYSQNFVDTEQRPQNFIRDVGLADRFEEYPKLRELIKLKNDLVTETAHPPMYLKCDLETYDLKSLDHKFDVILIEPPLEEYARSCGVTNVKFWDWDKIMALDIGEMAANRSFIFLWYDFLMSVTFQNITLE